MSLPCIIVGDKGVYLNIIVQPRCSRNEIVGLQGDLLKIKLKAPPVDGEANRCCIDFLAERFSVGRSRITILKGHSSRKKRIFIEHDSPQSFAREIENNLKQ